MGLMPTDSTASTPRYQQKLRQTVLAALSRLRKDITVAVASVKADSQEFVEITISVEVPLLPKVLSSFL